jgi:hypothetical protein
MRPASRASVAAPAFVRSRGIYSDVSPTPRTEGGSFLAGAMEDLLGREVLSCTASDGPASDGQVSYALRLEPLG